MTLDLVEPIRVDDEPPWTPVLADMFGPPSYVSYRHDGSKFYVADDYRMRV